MHSIARARCGGCSMRSTRWRATTPVIIGGDLNTGLADGNGDFEKETLFAHAYATVATSGMAARSTRPPRAAEPGQPQPPSGTWKLDWFLTRGLIVEESRIVPAVAPDGEVLSDHEMIVAKVGGFRG
jgi:endonuclease/exonuclease/phosphatase family metal-dependent hydrolase